MAKPHSEAIRRSAWSVRTSRSATASNLRCAINLPGEVCSIWRKRRMTLDTATRLRLDATHPSDLVYGPGALYIRPKGTVVIFR